MVAENTALITHQFHFVQKPWSFVTYVLVTPGMGRFLILGLIEIAMFWSFANIVKQFVGEEKSARLILFSWLIVPVPVALLAALNSFNSEPFLAGFNTMTLCAVGAAIMVAPTYPVMLWGIVQMPILWLGLIVIALEMAGHQLWRTTPGISAMIAPAVGALWVYLLRRGTDITAWMRFDFLKRGRSRPSKSSSRKSPMRVVHSKPAQQNTELDRLLDKINEVGIEGLTREEREALYRLSREDDNQKPPGRS